MSPRHDPPVILSLSRPLPRSPSGSPARRRRVALLGTTLALALTGAAAGAAPASAVAPPGFVGLQGWEVPTAQQFQRVAAARVSTYRAGVFWADVESRRGRYDWTGPDELFRRSAAVGVRILPVMTASPTWASSKSSWLPTSTHARRAYAEFVAATVRRYGPQGSFWSEHPELTPHPPEYWQIWNEPSLPGNRPNPRRYAAILKSASAAARGVLPGAKIVVAGLPPTKPGTRGIPIAEFVRGIERVRGAKAAFDVIALHPYARDYRGVLRELDNVRRVLRRYRDSRKSTWVTEVGWATGGPFDRRGFTTTRAGQASRLRKVFRVLQARRAKYRLLGAIWFSLQDPLDTRARRDAWGFHTGLFDKYGRAKPAWDALLEVTGGSDTVPYP